VKATITGGSGYIGALLADELLATGHEVRVLDALIHGQDDIAAQLEAKGVEVIRGDLRDASLREQAFSGADAIVHLAAIVGDPACGRDPELSNSVNVEGSQAVVADARRLGVEKLVFASTSSNNGPMADTTVPIDESGELAPV
jgi:nucleoside-diphosphate-sugar epimerase